MIRQAQVRRLMFLAVVAALLLQLTGCTYMKARGRDAMDMFDVGITVNDSVVPQFGCYFDQFTVIGIGYSHVDCKVLGVVNRHAGFMNYKNHDWNALVWGSKQDGAEPFNPADPRQARQDQRNLKERPAFDTGFVREIPSENTPPPLQFAQCNRIIHLGYVGVIFNVRPGEILDFILGWSTLDIIGDDDLKDPDDAASTTEVKKNDEKKSDAK